MRSDITSDGWSSVTPGEADLRSVDGVGSGEGDQTELLRENQRLRAELADTLGALTDLRERFALLAQASAEPDPRPGLREIAALGRRLREFEADQVQAALARGFSYAEIAAELGITRQSVHQKHARRAGTRPSDPGDSPETAPDPS